MSSKNLVFGKSEIFFTIFRYLSYGLQAIRGFVLAYFLGPFFLGIYGYLMLYQQYLSYSNIGIVYSVNSELASLEKAAVLEREKIINSAFSTTCFISIALVGIGALIYFLKIPLFPFTKSYRYVLVLIPLTILSHFQQIFVNIFRIDKKLKPIIVGELMLSIGLLIIVVFFKKLELVNAIFLAWIVLLGLVVIYYRVIAIDKISFDSSRIRLLLQSGFPLLIYNFSYYLMNLMVRTLIGAFYPVVVMGYFSFANNITTAVMLGIDTITWIIFPSIIAKLANDQLDKTELSNYLVSFTNKLVVLVLIIVSIGILALPILFMLLPKYQPIEYSLIILMVNQIIFNTGFVFISLVIAKKLHKEVAIISLLSTIVGCLFAGLFCYLKLPYIWLVISNIISSLFFVNALVWYISDKFDISRQRLLASFDWIVQVIFILIVVAAVLEYYWIVIIMLASIYIYRLSSLKALYCQLKMSLIKR